MPKNAPFPGRFIEMDQYYHVVVPYLTLAANATRLGISAANTTTVAAAFAQWNVVFPASQNPDLATKTIIDNKNSANTALQTILRAIYHDIPKSRLTAQDRNTLNLPARKVQRTSPPAPSTKPIATVDTSKRAEHTLYFADEGSPGSRAKPAGTRGCQVWAKTGSAAASVSELRYLATATASPYRHQFNFEDAGKPVHYWLRWENSRGEPGPWSDVLVATITG